MKKRLLLLLTAMLCVSGIGVFAAEYPTVYLRGSVNEWLNGYLPGNPDGVPAEWIGTPNDDGTVYVWDWSGNPKLISNEFKFADASWGDINYGAESYLDQEVELGAVKKISYNGLNFNVPTNAEWTISKVTLNFSDETILFEGESQEKVYDPDKDYGVMVRFDMDIVGVAASDKKFDMEFKGGGVYSAQIEITEELNSCYYGFKIADATWGDINFGMNGYGESLQPNEYMQMIEKASFGVTFPFLLEGTIVEVEAVISDFSTAKVKFSIISEPEVDKTLYLVGDEVSEGKFLEEYRSSVVEGESYTQYRWDFAEPIELSGHIYFSNTEKNLYFNNISWEGIHYEFYAGFPSTYLRNLDNGVKDDYTSVLGKYSISRIIINDNYSYAQILITVEDILDPYYFDLYLYGSFTGMLLKDEYMAEAQAGVYTWNWSEDDPFVLDAGESFAFREYNRRANFGAEYGIDTSVKLPAGKVSVDLPVVPDGWDYFVAAEELEITKMVLNVPDNTLQITVKDDMTTGIAETGRTKIFADGGRIFCEGEFAITDLSGRNVTAQNGNLNGMYIVTLTETGEVVKVFVK